MKIVVFLLLMLPSFAWSQSVQAWVGSPYYVNMDNQFNYQFNYHAGVMFKLNSGKNNLGLGLEYATKNVDSGHPFKYKLPQLNMLIGYERMFDLNAKNRLAFNAALIVGFRLNSSYTLGNGERTAMTNGAAVLGRVGFKYYRVLSERVSLFGGIFAQYKVIQDMEEYYWKYHENPRDKLSVGFNVGVEFKLFK